MEPRRVDTRDIPCEGNAQHFTTSRSYSGQPNLQFIKVKLSFAAMGCLLLGCFLTTSVFLSLTTLHYRFHHNLQVVPVTYFYLQTKDSETQNAAKQLFSWIKPRPGGRRTRDSQTQVLPFQEPGGHQEVRMHPTHSALQCIVDSAPLGCPRLRPPQLAPPERGRGIMLSGRGTIGSHRVITNFKQR